MRSSSGRLVWAFTLLCLGAGAARADFEADLLRKFQNENVKAKDKVKQEAENLLAQATLLITSEPAKAHDLLRKGQELLREDTQLPKNERSNLLRSYEDRLREVRERLKVREDETKPVPPVHAEDKSAPPHQMIRPPFFTPNFTPFPTQSSFQVSPVVSPDRRYVRVGVSGSFSTFTPRGPLVPIQFPAPNVLQGPGNATTILRPITVTKSFVGPAVALPVFTQIGIDTTVTAPTGGAIVAGSFRTYMEGRNEFGTPGLGHIPYLGRLGRNTSYGRSSSITQIVIAPTIISLAEEEERLFGPNFGR